jgi:hypothetical protein
VVVGDGIEALVQAVLTANIDASQQFAVTERALNRASAVSHWARAEGSQDIIGSNTFYTFFLSRKGKVHFVDSLPAGLTRPSLALFGAGSMV